jgi:gamma-glutamyl hercynylcysteine S-oxide synthase
VRERALEVLDEVEIGPDSPDPLLRGGFIYEMLIAHELQHDETMLQLLMMVAGYELPQEVRVERAKAIVGAPTSAGEGGQTIRIDAGEHEVGAAGGGFAYDNERPRHTVALAPFEIDRFPTTNGAYIAHIEETGAEPPLYWERDGEGGWLHTAMGHREPIEPVAPLIHVSWDEADAFARRAGRRLPTEFEWEAAHTTLIGDGGPPRGGLPGAGHGWEWTSSHLLPYPGFEAFPYREYSAVFFGDEHRVLRGGSWATSRETMRPSFRNWDLPQRRQIFAGFRCASDAG